MDESELFYPGELIRLPEVWDLTLPTYATYVEYNSRFGHKVLLSTGRHGFFGGITLKKLSALEQLARIA